MKHLLFSLFENTQPVSKKLLFSCFIAGYLVATVFFGFFGLRFHHFLNTIIQGLWTSSMLSIISFKETGKDRSL